MGPDARELLARVRPDDVSPAGLKFTHTKEIDLGHASARAARMSYVGGPGYELQVPVEMARHVHLALQEAGAGGEAIAIDGATVGELSSVGYSPKAGARVGLGYVRGAAALVVNNGTPVHIDLWGQPVAARAWDDWPHQPA